MAFCDFRSYKRLKLVSFVTKLFLNDVRVIVSVCFFFLFIFASLRVHFDIIYFGILEFWILGYLFN